MSRNNSHNKRNLSSSSSSPITDGKKCKIFITPNRFATLDEDTASLPEVFSPPPVKDLLSVQGETSNQTSTQTSINTASYKAPTIYNKNVSNFSKLKYDLISIVGPDVVTFKSSKEFLTIRTAN